MSSISATSAGQGLAQFLKNLSAGSSSQSTSAVPSDITVNQTAAGTASAPAQGHHHHHGGNGEMLKKIQDAVTSALQSAQSDGSADPNQVIEDAIAKALQDGGAASAAGSDPTAAGNAAAAADDGDAQAAGGADGNGASRQAFFKMLNSFGVDPKQFRADLVAAINDAKGGQVDASTAFKSFPPGVAVDEVG